jgi:hypothetical protein
MGIRNAALRALAARWRFPVQTASITSLLQFARGCAI